MMSPLTTRPWHVLCDNNLMLSLSFEVEASMWTLLTTLNVPV